MTSKLKSKQLIMKVIPPFVGMTKEGNGGAYSSANSITLIFYKSTLSIKSSRTIDNTRKGESLY
jgi:hypothetical protein